MIATTVTPATGKVPFSTVTVPWTNGFDIERRRLDIESSIARRKPDAIRGSPPTGDLSPGVNGINHPWVYGGYDSRSRLTDRIRYTQDPRSNALTAGDHSWPMLKLLPARSRQLMR